MPKKQTAKSLKITLTKSTIGEKPNTKSNITGLGLKKIGQHVTREDTPCVRGMIHKVRHLVSVEE